MSRRNRIWHNSLNGLDRSSLHQFHVTDGAHIQHKHSIMRTFEARLWLDGSVRVTTGEC